MQRHPVTFVRAFEKQPHPSTGLARVQRQPLTFVRADEKQLHGVLALDPRLTQSVSP